MCVCVCVSTIVGYRGLKLGRLTLDSLLLTIPLDLEVKEALMGASEDLLPCYSVMLDHVSVWRAVYVLRNRFSMVFLSNMLPLNIYLLY